MANTTHAAKSKAHAKKNRGLKEFLQIQERLTEDYLGIRHGKIKKNKCKWTLVRGPNNEILLVGEKMVIKVNDQNQVDQFLQDLNDLVSDYIANHIPRLVAGPGVHVGTAEIFV